MELVAKHPSTWLSCLAKFIPRIGEVHSNKKTMAGDSDAREQIQEMAAVKEMFTFETPRRRNNLIKMGVDP